MEQEKRMSPVAKRNFTAGYRLGLYAGNRLSAFGLKVQKPKEGEDER